MNSTIQTLVLIASVCGLSGCSDKKEANAPNAKASPNAATAPVAKPALAPSTPTPPLTPVEAVLTAVSAIFDGSSWCISPGEHVPPQGVAGLSVCTANAAHSPEKGKPVSLIRVNGIWCVRGEGLNGGNGLSPSNGARGLNGCAAGAQPDPV